MVPRRGDECSIPVWLENKGGDSTKVKLKKTWKTPLEKDSTSVQRAFSQKGQVSRRWTPSPHSCYWRSNSYGVKTTFCSEEDLLLLDRIGVKGSIRKAENFVRHGKTTDIWARRITSNFWENFNYPFKKWLTKKQTITPKAPSKALT